MRITVIGAGAWGTAIAMAACRIPGHAVRLHARDEAQAAALRDQGQNARYLPGVDLPSGLNILSGPLAPLVAQAMIVGLGRRLGSVENLQNPENEKSFASTRNLAKHGRGRAS